MKKLIALALAAAMALSLAACGSNSKPSNNGSSNTASPGTQSSAQPGAASSGEPSGGSWEEINWPNPMTLYVGYSAGGASDLMARCMADALSRKLGVSVVVEDMPGSGSWLMYTFLQEKAPKDGSALCLINMGSVSGYINPEEHRPYGKNDFEYLTCQVSDPEALAIRPNETRFHDIPSLIEYAQENEIFVSGGADNLSDTNCFVEFMRQNYNTKITIVPADGSGDDRSMFLAGDTDIMSTSLSELGPNNGTDYNVLMIYQTERSEDYPDIPCSKELGYEWIGFSARGYAYAKGVDSKIVDAMRDVMVDIYHNDQTYLDAMAAIDMPMHLSIGETWVDELWTATRYKFDLWGYSYPDDY